MRKHPRPQVEFERLVYAGQIGERGTLQELSATEAERAALVRRFDLMSLERLEAGVRLREIGKGLARATGRLVADVVQRCVVTLNPVQVRLEKDFSIVFSADAAAKVAEIVVAADRDDPPEAMVDGWIDLGEAVVQQFALALDPYPRVADAALPSGCGVGDRSGGDDKTDSPFAVLGPRRIRN